MDVLTWGLLAGGIFGHSSTGAKMSEPKCLCQNVHIALQGTKISMCQNVQVPKYPMPKHPWYQKFLVPKCPHAKKSMKTKSAGTSAGPKHAHAEMSC